MLKSYALASAALLIGFLSAPVTAHDIHLTASAEGKTIRGRVTYPDGSPVKNCTVTGHDAADEAIAKTATDDDGRYSFEARWRCDYHLEAETSDGHGKEYVLKAALLPSDLPERENSANEEKHADAHSHSHAAENPGDENPWTIEQIRLVQSKLDALGEKIEANEKGVRLRDILGGIGYILGVFGLFAMIANRKKTK
jgi:nickel transport protein